jgi:hypothetical protein
MSAPRRPTYPPIYAGINRWISRIFVAVLSALAAVSALLAPGPAHAVETAEFLTLGPGARGVAMGSAYSALSDGADSLYWNPAGLARMTQSEFMADDAELPQSTRVNDAFLAVPTKYGTFGAGATYLSQSAIEGRDANGNPIGYFSASDGDGALGYALKTDFVDVGASVKYIRSHVGSVEAQTFAVDAGVRRAFGPLSVAAGLRNAGPGMKFEAETDDLPLRLDVGAAYRFDDRAALTAEFTNGPRGGGSTGGVGGEVQVLKGVFFRAGYASQSQVTGGSGLDAVSGLTFGFGLKQPRWSFDYAAAPMGELGNTQRFSAAIRW